MRLLPALILSLGSIVVFALVARASEPSTTCPKDAPICKVVTITPQEEQALTGPNMILDAAVYARRMELEQAATYFRNKLKEAPQGVPFKEEKK